MWKNEANPFLPPVGQPLSHQDMEALGGERGPQFYETALKYAQSLGRCGFPAKSLLLCNRALMTPVKKGDAILKANPLPYKAIAWLMVNRREGQFLGNPRYHYQHLASRLRGPGKELAVWRSWACWYLAKEVLPEGEFPADLVQIRSEQLIEPAHDTIVQQLRKLSSAGDEQAWADALHWCQPWRPARPHGRHRVSIRQIGTGELAIVQKLAYHIWPRVYPGIISEGQIRHMLEQFYDLGILWDEVQRRAVCYALIEVDGRPSGYLSFEAQRQDKSAFLHKLYLLPEFHRMGAGALALGWVENAAARAGLRRVRLRVNKRNAPAIRAYLRRGFRFAGDIVSDIGGGYVMDDCWMEKDLG